MYPKEICFSNDFEKVKYMEYISSRGRGVFEDSLNALLKYTGESVIDYYDFMGFIRYDKCLRDVLYKMLGALEEFLKNTLYKLIDYNGEKPFRKVTSKNIMLFTRIGSKEYGWKLYRNPRLEFGSLVYLYKHFQFTPPCNSFDFFCDLDNVNLLRNLVMHHKMLLIDQSKSNIEKGDITERVLQIRNCIISVYNLLQPDYNKGLISAVNKANYDYENKCIKSRFIYIERLDGGYENDTI
jgi:hypothetical protein